MRAIFALICFAGIFAGRAGAQANENPLYLSPRGPIPIRNMRPYNLLFLQFLPDSGDALAAGKAASASNLTLRTIC